MAAGLGKRMHSKLAKVLHPVAGKPMVNHMVELAGRLAGHRVAVVVGYQGADVRAASSATVSCHGGERTADCRCGATWS